MHVYDFEQTVNTLKAFLPQYLTDSGIDITSHFTCIYPDHEDSTPSCNLVGLDTDSPRGYCHGCGRSFDIFDAVQILEGKPAIGQEWVESTLKYLAEKYGVEVATKELTEEQIYELDVYRVYRAASELVQNKGIPKSNKLYWNELKKRGWKATALSRYGVGTVLSYNYFVESLKSQGFTQQFLKEADLLRQDLFNPEHLIFTWKDEKGRPIGFSARNLEFEQQVKAKKKAAPKYVNQRTTGLKCNIFKKSQRFYGTDEAVKTSGTLYIFEGQADVITARHHGILNCVAISGSVLHDHHVQLLKDLGFLDIILCFDGDEAGRDKMKGALEEKLAGNRDMKIRVIMLPDDEDPDSYIRSLGADGFLSLANWSAFEWRLNQYSDDFDEEEICRQMIPFIVNESSPITREYLCKILSKRTGVTLKSVTAELNQLLDAKALAKSRERQQLLERAMYELRRDPENAETILQKARTSLLEVIKKHDADTLSNEDFVRTLDEQKAKEEQTVIEDSGFNLGPDLKELEDAFRGEWSEGIFVCVGGKPNVGKSAFLSKMAYSIASHNEDVCVIYHTIDDTAAQLIPRLITLAEGSHELSINMVRQPNYWTKTAGVEFCMEKREVGYARVRELAKAGRLVVKDLDHGGSLPFAENVICYYKEKYPDRRVVYILDNFHKLRDFQGQEERVRFKSLSEATKTMALQQKCCIIASVEYTKLPPGQKPTNHNIGECLVGDTEVLADGVYCCIDEVVPGMCVASMTDCQQIVENTVLAKLDKGIQKVYRVTTQTGRTLETTINHPFYSENGWTKLSDLGPGAWVAIPRNLLDHIAEENFPPDLARLLGYLAGNGSYAVYNKINQTPSFINSTTDYLKDVESIVTKHFDVVPKSKQHNGSIQLSFSRKNGTAQQNPVVTWLKELGIHGQTKENKQIPKLIFTSSRVAKAHYLAGLFATDGCVTDNRDHRILFINKSRHLAHGCQRLLLSIGIQSSVVGPDQDQLYKVTVLGTHALRFAELVPLTGYKGRLLLSIRLDPKKVTNSGDLLPPVFTKAIKAARLKDNQPVRYSDGYWIQQETINRSRAQKLCNEIVSNQSALVTWAHSNIFWDRIVDVKPVGEKHVWDLTIAGTHNFIANDIFCHNTGQIEYDASAIIHLYSEVADQPDSFNVYHEAHDWQGQKVLLPRVEFYIGKNKITELKKTFFLDFFPASSEYKHVDQKQVLADSKKAKQDRFKDKTESVEKIADLIYDSE
jgi:DNA primase catalytic core